MITNVFSFKKTFNSTVHAVQILKMCSLIKKNDLLILLLQRVLILAIRNEPFSYLGDGVFFFSTLFPHVVIRMFFGDKTKFILFSRWIVTNQIFLFYTLVHIIMVELFHVSPISNAKPNKSNGNYVKKLSLQIMYITRTFRNIRV